MKTRGLMTASRFLGLVARVTDPLLGAARERVERQVERIFRRERLSQKFCGAALRKMRHKHGIGRPPAVNLARMAAAAP